MMVLRHIGLGQTPSATVVHPDDEDVGHHEREERTIGGAIPMDLSNKPSVRTPTSHHNEVPRHLKINNNNNNNNSSKNNNNIHSLNNNNSNNVKKPPLLSIFPTPPLKRSLTGKETNILSNISIVGRPHPSPSDPTNTNTNSIRWRNTGGGEDDASYSSPDSGLHRDSPGEDEEAGTVGMNNNHEGRKSSSPPTSGLLRSRQSLIPLSLIRARYNHNHHHLNRSNINHLSQQENENDNEGENENDGAGDREEEGDDDEDNDNEGQLTISTGPVIGGRTDRDLDEDDEEDDEDCHLRPKSSTTSSHHRHHSHPHHHHHVRKDPNQTKRMRLEQMVSHIKRTTTSPSDRRDRGHRSRRHSGDDDGDDTSSGGHGTSGDEISGGGLGEDLRATDLRRSNSMSNSNSKNNNNKNSKNNSSNFTIHRTRPTASEHSSPVPYHHGVGERGINLKSLPFSIASNRTLFQSSSDNEFGDEPCNLVCNNNNNNSINSGSNNNNNNKNSPSFPLTMPDISHFMDGKGGGAAGLLGSLNGNAGGGGVGGLGGIIPNLSNLKNFNPSAQQQPLSPSDASKLYGMDPEAYQQQMMQLQLQASMLGDPGGLLKAVSMGQYPPWVYLLTPYSQLLHSFQAQEMLRQYAIQSQTPTISQGEKSPTILLRNNLSSSNYNCGGSPVSPASVSEGGGPAGMDSDGSVVGQSTGGGNGKRAPRAMTGRHVRTGTGASPTTLQTLRLKIEERQRLKAQQLRHDIMLQTHANHSNHSSNSSKGKNSKFMKKFKK